MTRILAIETSCDETAISIIECKHGTLHILANVIFSQIDIHRPYGGVFPMLAKREHGKNLIPLLNKALTEATLNSPSSFYNSNKFGLKLNNAIKEKNLRKILKREPELLDAFLDFIPKIKIPKIDAVAVTHGPGLEPALWVGINFAKALATVWNKPIIPINHMEGHIVAALLSETNIIRPSFPVIALLISGGHTELVLMRDWFKYRIIGETRDDAVGECFDKSARVLGLPYPGGPEISKLAEEWRVSNQTQIHDYQLPRPMLKTSDFDFSFAGLKTAVLYMSQKIPKMTDNIRREICYEFEEAVTEVLVHKTLKAIEKYKVKTLIIGGGVSANAHVQETFRNVIKNIPGTKLLIPDQKLSTDNALMIAFAAHLRLKHQKTTNPQILKARGNLRL